MKTYHVIGLMSGTSLDGLDIVYCSFSYNKGKWNHSIIKAQTIVYKKDWIDKLSTAQHLSGKELISLHSEYGKFIGREVVQFIGKNRIKEIDFIASHGHTVFHQPSNGFTFQLGNGAAIAATCGIPVVYDFRTLDVALKGQGAPLVPVGDELLFPDYKYCLNLGGFSNISYTPNPQFGAKKGGKRVAFDICPVNIILNQFASLKGKKYDRNGSMAKAGEINLELLEKLNSIGYYSSHNAGPKSLSREWIENVFLPVMDIFSIKTEDKLATVTEHIAIQIAKVISGNSKKGNILVTGGGVYNTFLIGKIKSKLLSHEVVIPDDNHVQFKEALIFAFLGVLRMENKINTYKSVTGALHDSSGGVLVNYER